MLETGALTRVASWGVSVGIVMTDDQLNGKVAEIVAELRRALQEAAAVAHDIQRRRAALVEIGSKAHQLVLREKNSLSCGDLAVDPWPTHDDVVSALGRDLRLRDQITELRGRLRQMGIGPELFE